MLRKLRLNIKSTFISRYNQLTGQFLRTFSSEKPGENIAFSPFSIISMLSILADATGGDTREEILNALYGWMKKREGLPEQLRATGKELSRIDFDSILTDAESYGRKPIPADYSRHLNTTNMLFVREDYEKSIRPEFTKDFREQYDGMVIGAKDIDAAMGAIYTMLDNGTLDAPEGTALSQSILTLFNAVFFDAMWMAPYEDKNTEEQVFTNLDGTRSRVNMLQGTEAAYIESEYATGFIKDFQQCEYSFMALLPKEKGPEALQDLIREFHLHDFLKDSNTSSNSNSNSDSNSITVRTAMPEFTIESEQNLKQACADLGITEALTTNADFTPMSAFKLPARKLTHKAKIRVDRNGASVTAATRANIQPSLPTKKAKKVVLNRPFLFAIYHRTLEIPVLIGVVNNIETNKQ